MMSGKEQRAESKEVAESLINGVIWRPVISPWDMVMSFTFEDGTFMFFITLI